MSSLQHDLNKKQFLVYLMIMIHNDFNDAREEKEYFNTKDKSKHGSLVKVFPLLVLVKLRKGLNCLNYIDLHFLTMFLNPM